MARRSLVIVAVVFLFAAGTLGAAPDPKEAKADLDGVYTCEGANPDGSPYKGLVEIVSEGDVVLMKWEFDDTAMVGVGILRDDMLSVSYFIGVPALAVYKIEKGTDGKGNKLQGTWTVAGAGDHLFSETLTRIHGRIDAVRYKV
jgi:hypothetical protein